MTRGIRIACSVAIAVAIVVLSLLMVGAAEEAKYGVLLFPGSLFSKYLLDSSPRIREWLELPLSLGVNICVYAAILAFIWNFFAERGE